MTLWKTVQDRRGIYRIFQADRGVFHVLNEDGHTVDQFDIQSKSGADGISVKRAVRNKPLAPGIPDLARKFAADMDNTRA